MSVDNLRGLPWCDRCLRIAIPIATRYGERCTCPTCGSWSWGRKPLADRATHDARKAAHAAFDPLWKGFDPFGDEPKLTRSGAYRLLAEWMSLPGDRCHMAIMDCETAERVPVAVAAIRRAMECAPGLQAPFQLDLFRPLPELPGVVD